MKMYRIILLLSLCLSTCFAFFFGFLENRSSAIQKQANITSNEYLAVEIVINDTISTQLQKCVNTFQEYLFKGLDVRVPVVQSPSGGKLSIHVGNTAYVSSKSISSETLDDDGFLFLNEGDNNFIILGGSDWGTEFGVYTFLEEYLDVRWLMPTDLGTDIPKKENLILDPINREMNPGYFSRHLSPIDIDDSNELGRWARFNKVRQRVRSNHNLSNLFDVEKFGQSNRDFYPYVNGEIYLPTNSEDHRWNPNFFAPGLADSAASVIRLFFKNSPNEDSYSLSINDDPSRFDRSPLSLKKRIRRSNYLGLVDLSEEYFRWANNTVSLVERYFPNKLYGTLAYNNLITPPSSTLKVHRNIVPFITNERIRWANPKFRAADVHLTEQWKKASEKVGWYDYAYGRTYFVPRIWFSTMSEYLKWGNQNGIDYYAAELYPNWGEGPKAYLLTKLLWDPSLDPHALVEEWCQRFAGEKAASKLQSYFAIWDKFWTDEIQYSSWYNLERIYLDFNDLSYLKSVTPSHVQESDRLLREAYNLADNDLHRKRIKTLIDMWALYKAAIEFYHNNSESISKIEDLKRSTAFMSQIDKLREDTLYEEPITYIRKYLKYK